MEILEHTEEFKFSNSKPFRNKRVWKIDFNLEDVHDWYIDVDILMVRFKREDKKYTQFIREGLSENPVPIRTTITKLDEDTDLIVIEKEL